MQLQDDILGTLSKAAADSGNECYILTGQLNLPKKLWNKSFLAEENAFHYNKKEARLLASFFQKRNNKTNYFFRKDIVLL